MIDIISYRIRIGSHHSSTSRHKGHYHNSSHNPHNNHPQISKNTTHLVFPSFLFYLTMIIFAALSMAMTLDLSSNNEVFNKRSCKIDDPISSLGSYCGPLVDALLALLTVVIYHTFSKHQDPKHSSILTLYRHIRFGYSRKSILLYRCFRRFLVWIGVINLLLLTYSNMSINNPGPPQNLSVLYQNVQGLIPVSELINRNPSLNETKLAELQAHVYTNKPDIIILNETWLKESINDNEIFPPEAYKIFRCDRSTNSHPLDPNNPNRFRKNGGGVLTAINSSSDVTSQKNQHLL